MFARPLDGILFDVEQNAFWPRELGERPPDFDAAFRLITAWIDAAPKLIPVMGHRYLPDRAHDVTAAISPSISRTSTATTFAVREASTGSRSRCGGSRSGRH
jgi:hypothetical protein